MLTLCLYTEEIYIWLLYNFSSTLLLTSRHLHTLLSAYAFSLLLFDMFTSTWENLSVYRRHPLRHCSMYYYWFAAVMGRVILQLVLPVHYFSTPPLRLFFIAFFLIRCAFVCHLLLLLLLLLLVACLTPDCTLVRCLQHHRRCH